MGGQGSAIGRRSAVLAVLALALFFAPGQDIWALETPPSEADALKACEKRVCTMILAKGQPLDGGDLVCILSKTWGKSSLEGGKSKGIGWGFGDARCGTKINVRRAEVAAALTKPAHTMQAPDQMVRCVVERGGKEEPVSLIAAPRVDFKNGKANKVWINLKGIDGPADIKTTVSLAASLEDSLGIFHRQLVKSINTFIRRKCSKNYGPAALAREERAKKKADAARKKADAAKKKAEAAKKKAEAKADAADGKAADDGKATDPTAKPVDTKPAGEKPAGDTGTDQGAKPADAATDQPAPTAPAPSGDAKPAEATASGAKAPETKPVEKAAPDSTSQGSGKASPVSP